MLQASYIEISESAIKNNLTFIQGLLGEKVVLSSVVKGNAYGHGIEYFCPLVYKYGVRHFSVFNAYEAYCVLQSLPIKDFTLMIMGEIDNEQLEWAIENDVEFYVFETDRLDAAIKTAKKVQKPAKIHLQLETGMNRLGFDSKESIKVLKKIEMNAELVFVKGICTHLAGAESISNYKRIKDQKSQFNRMTKKLKSFEWLTPKLHLASSAATIRYPNSIKDLARIGILQYGFFPTEEILVHFLSKNKQFENPLQRVISWKTRVMDIKEVKAGEFVGYGTSYFANKSKKIAHLPVGYADGYSRSLSNQGKVLIKGERVNVVGTVNMSMLAVDVTHVEGVQKGDEAILIGSQGDLEIGVSSFSDYSQLITYELLTRLPQKIPRIITL
jgi:alanine racemase